MGRTLTVFDLQMGMPTYLELDAQIIDPNQLLRSPPVINALLNPYNSSSPDLKPDFVGTQFAVNHKNSGNIQLYDYNFKGVEPSIQGEGIDLVWELKMDAPLTGEVKLRPQFRSDSNATGLGSRSSDLENVVGERNLITIDCTLHRVQWNDATIYTISGFILQH